MADCEQAHLDEFIYNTYVQEKPMHIESVGPAKERIVRCRDCVYRRRSWNGHEPNFIGDWFCSYTGGHEVKPDGFCYRGERRADG